MDATINSRLEKSQFDFAKYRRPELFEQIAELLSVPATIGTILKWSAIAVIAAWIGLPAYFAGRVHWSMLAGLLVYGTIAAIIVGALLGVAAKLAKSFEDLSSVVATTISVAEEVSTDVDAMRDGDTRIPTGEETLLGVYDHVVMPAVKAAATRNAWFVGQFAFWVHKWTLNRIVKKLVRAVSSDERVGEVGMTFEKIDGTADRTAAWLRSAHTYLDSIGSRVRGIVTLPLIMLLTVFFVLLALPIVVVWWFV